jgi:hypothetical protein
VQTTIESPGYKSVTMEMRMSDGTRARIDSEGHSVLLEMNPEGGVSRIPRSRTTTTARPEQTPALSIPAPTPESADIQAPGAKSARVLETRDLGERNIDGVLARGRSEKMEMEPGTFLHHETWKDSQGRPVRIVNDAGTKTTQDFWYLDTDRLQPELFDVR